MEKEGEKKKSQNQPLQKWNSNTELKMNGNPIKAVATI